MLPPTIRAAPTSAMIRPKPAATAATIPVRASRMTVQRTCQAVAPKLRNCKTSSDGTAVTAAIVMPASQAPSGTPISEAKSSAVVATRSDSQTMGQTSGLRAVTDSSPLAGSRSLQRNRGQLLESLVRGIDDDARRFELRHAENRLALLG